MFDKNIPFFESSKSRITGEGLIGIYTSPERNQAAMVEVKCETDFVAKNSNFIQLVTKLAQKLASQSQSNFADLHDDDDCIQKMWIVDEKKLNEIGAQQITDAIAKLGENIRFVRGCIVRIRINNNNPTSNSGNDEGPILLPYTHAVSGKINSNEPSVILGKYGTIIALVKSMCVFIVYNNQTL